MAKSTPPGIGTVREASVTNFSAMPPELPSATTRSPDPHVGDARPDGLDDARHLAARRERRRRLELVLALDDEKIGEVDAAGAHADEHLTGDRPGIGHLFDRERVDGAVGVTDEGFHRRITSGAAAPSRAREHGDRIAPTGRRGSLRPCSSRPTA